MAVPAALGLPPGRWRGSEAARGHLGHSEPTTQRAQPALPEEDQVAAAPCSPGPSELLCSAWELMQFLAQAGEGVETVCKVFLIGPYSKYFLLLWFQRIKSKILYRYLYNHVTIYKNVKAILSSWALKIRPETDLAGWLQLATPPNTHRRSLSLPLWVASVGF